jgi:hypothetical protein
MRIRAVAEEVGHEPHATDMGGNVGAYVRIFGTWEHAKEEAGVKGYIAPEKEHLPVPTYTYKYHLSKDELAEERGMFEERQAARAGALPEPRPFVLTTHLGRNLKKLRDDEYLPSRDAVDVAQSAHR